MDTRHKIINLAQASALADEARRGGSTPIAFVTHLEVLGASHVSALQELVARTPGKLFLILTDPESPLVPIDARAELAAALRMVDYVIPSADGAAPALAAVNPGTIVYDEDKDRMRTHQLIEHVRSRSRI